MTFGWSTFALILVFAGKGFLADGACPSEFSDLSPQHTLCLTDKGKAVTLTSQQKQAVVDRHNEIRGQVSPKATNMQKLVWDDSLAEVAGKWARQCVDDHDDDKNRALPGMPGVYIGQNMAYGRDDPVAATNYWQTEIKDFTYGTNTGKIFGHYTQEIWDVTGRIGCGVADCSAAGAKYKAYVACNYAVGGNFNWEQRGWKPYTEGDSCGACPGKCDSSGKLCDCGGLVCYNDGTLDISTCSCKCTALYKGTNCETKSCPGQDWDQCEYNLSVFGKETACGWSNIQAKCPNACGLC